MNWTEYYRHADTAPPAGWDIEHPQVVRLCVLVWAMREHVESAWNSEQIDAAIRRAKRYKVLSEALGRAKDLYPDYRAHGPHMTYRHTWLEAQRVRNEAWRVAVDRMNENLRTMLHGENG